MKKLSPAFCFAVICLRNGVDDVRMPALELAITLGVVGRRNDPLNTILFRKHRDGPLILRTVIVE